MVILPYLYIYIRTQVTHSGEQGALPDPFSSRRGNGGDQNRPGNHSEGDTIQKIDPTVGPHIKCTLVIKIGE